MSGVLKGVTKVFKKVAKVVKKVAPIALAIAAVVYTGGAALGATPTLGAAMGSLTSSMGLSGTLGSVVTGALTQAGYGAAIGAATSAITGGDIMKGMQGGALTGAITGGVTGSLGFKTDLIGDTVKDSLNSGASAAETAASNAVTGAPVGVTGEPMIGNYPGQPGGAAGVDVGAIGDAPTAFDPNVSAGQEAMLRNAFPGGIGTPQQPMLATGRVGFGNEATREVLKKTGGVFDEGGWLERNGSLVGQTISGLGTGLMKGLSAESEQEMLEQRERTRLATIRANYGGANGTPTRRGLMTQQQVPTGPGGNLTPEQRFSPSYYAESAPRLRYQYDVASGQIYPTRVY